MTAASDRLELSRLVHRFGLGPKPGEYVQLLHAGIPQARARILARRADPGLKALVTPQYNDLGQAPSDPTASSAYWTEVWEQSLTVGVWWMDRMVLADFPFIERMTWFWHGHWATSISKVSFARPMKIQNDTLRSHALEEIRSAALTKGATSGSSRSAGAIILCSFTSSRAISATLAHSLPTGDTASQKVTAWPSTTTG